MRHGECGALPCTQPALMALLTVAGCEEGGRGSAGLEQRGSTGAPLPPTTRARALDLCPPPCLLRRAPAQIHRGSSMAQAGKGRMEQRDPTPG
jgi:hypothetical protein